MYLIFDIILQSKCPHLIAINIHIQYIYVQTANRYIAMKNDNIRIVFLINHIKVILNEDKLLFHYMFLIIASFNLILRFSSELQKNVRNNFFFNA